MRTPPRALVRALTAVAGVVVVAAGLAGCSRGESESLPRPNKAFCTAAYNYDKKVELKASLKVQIELVRKMADNAPKDIAKDTKAFLDALERYSHGDRSMVGKPKIRTAVDNVNRRAQNDCGLFQQDPPSGM